MDITKFFRRGQGKRLVYARAACCKCGARLAYAPRSDAKAWDCSAILTGVAVPMGQLGSVKHSDTYPFVFYNIESEK